MIRIKMCYANKKILKLKIKRYLISRVFNHVILEHCLDAKCACNCLEIVEITRKEEKYIWKFVIDWRQFIIWRIQMVLLWSFLLTDHLLFLFFLSLSIICTLETWNTAVSKLIEQELIIITSINRGCDRSRILYLV